MRKVRITTWKKFAREVRSGGCNLLARLDEFPNSILVTGCQRSGTTMLSRVITQSEGMVNYWFGRDDELDAALILSGYVDHRPRGRYCFQTTYLSNCFHEYFQHNQYKLIWLLRNPYSVVYSMLHNWRRGALNRLFKSCGASLLEGHHRRIFESFGVCTVSRLRRACFSYNAKTSQVFELRNRIPRDRLMVIDYDHLVTDTHNLLPNIYDFLNLKYNEYYAQSISPKSVKKVIRQSKKESYLVEKLCIPVYLKAKTTLTNVKPNAQYIT